MRILVTGAAGFVGTHAVRLLRSRGHEVVAATLEGMPVLDAKPLRMDVRDAHVVARAIERERPDAILHLAAIAFVPAVAQNPLLGFETNATGTLVVLAAAREAAPAARVVVVSTAEVYGRVPAGSGPVTEAAPLRPATLYGATKASAELVARAFGEEGQDVVILRPFNHIGPGQDEAYVVASFAAQVARLETAGGGVLRHGNLDAVRDFTDVRDVVRAYAIALEATVGTLGRGAAFNVCSGVGTSIGDLVRRMVAQARCRIATEPDPARMRTVDVPRFVGDPTLFRAATGFAPEIPLEQTLADILAAARGGG